MIELNIENKKKLMKIGILGAPINNDNMGCLALTYSILAILEEIATDLKYTFIYYVFEGVGDSDKMQTMCKNLEIETNRVKSINIYPLESFLGFCRRPHRVMRALSSLNKCDLFIDLTQGDSFSDIYGDSVFNKNVNGKLIIKKRIKKPLILGPQTYGPYQKEKNKEKAKKSIECADLVIARDETSAKYVKSFSSKKVHTTTDLAFRLPYKRADVNHSTIKVGINVSGLLSKNKVERTPTEFQLKTDYDLYINSLLTWLLDNNYVVSLIPHVIADYECNKQLVKKFPQIELIDMYKSPIDIKSKISEFDIFIGARMHATIGAFSSGVATIPNAYSRKFNGLYESVGYPYIVDLMNSSTDVNLEITKKYVIDYKNLKNVARKSMERINQLEEETVSLLKEQIIRASVNNK